MLLSFAKGCGAASLLVNVSQNLIKPDIGLGKLGMPDVMVCYGADKMLRFVEVEPIKTYGANLTKPHTDLSKIDIGPEETRGWLLWIVMVPTKQNQTSQRNNAIRSG